MFRKILIFGIGGLVLLLGAGELVIRATGITDFPIYEADSEIGYALNPNQHGRFLNKNEWFVNQKQQCTTEWIPSGKDDILLLGDSLVLGGNPLTQSDRLATRLQALIPESHVWPAAAGSWAVPNEVAYLNRYPEVARDAERLVWVLNSGDLDDGSVWKSEITHPRYHPWSSLLYVLEKYGQPKLLGNPVPEAGGVPVDPQIRPTSISLLTQKLAELRRQRPDRHVTLVVYPTADELRHTSPHSEAFYQRFLGTVREIGVDAGVSVIEIRADPRWRPEFYRDGIHPNAAGNVVLARIIADGMH